MDLRSMFKWMKGKDPADSKRSAGFTLTKPVWIDCFPDYDSHLSKVIPIFCRSQQDLSIKVVVNDHEDHHRKLASNFTTQSGAGDLVFIDVAKLGSLINTGAIAEMDTASDQIKKLWNKLPAYAWEQAQGPDGKYYAVPLDIGPGVLFYRREYVEKLGFDINVITRSWDDYFEFGAKLRRYKNISLLSNASDIADLIVNATISDGDGIYFDKQNRILINSERFVTALSMAKKARYLDLDYKVEPWSVRWRQLIRDGQIATLLSGAWMLGHLKNAIAPESERKWGVGPLPNSIFGSWGGSFLAIPRQGKHREAVWRFIHFLTAPEIQTQALKTIAAFPANKEAYSDPLFNEPIPYLDNQKAFQLFATVANKITPVKPHKADQIGFSIYKMALDDVLLLGKDIQSTLETAEQILQHRIRTFD